MVAEVAVSWTPEIVTISLTRILVVAVMSVKVPVVALLAPITDPSILPPLMSTDAAVKVPVKSALDMVRPLLVAVSELLTSSEVFAVRVVTVAAAGVAPPIITESKVPPLISAVVAVTALRVPRLVTLG